MQVSILKRIVEMLNERREKMQESGKKGRGLIKSLVEEHLPHFLCMTRNMLHHFITTYTNENMVPTVIQTKHHTVVSGLTNLTSLLLGAKRRSLAVVATTELIVIMEPAFATEDGANTEVTSPASTNTDDTANKGGRPNGSTNTAMNKGQSVITEDFNECVIEFTCRKALVQETNQNKFEKNVVCPVAHLRRQLQKCVRSTNWKETK
jgi:hypothetical protein